MLELYKEAKHRMTILKYQVKRFVNGTYLTIKICQMSTILISMAWAYSNKQQLILSTKYELTLFYTWLSIDLIDFGIWK